MSDRDQSKQLSKTVVSFQQSGDYFFHKGLRAFQKKHLQNALKQFERAVKLSASEPAFQIQLAIVLAELGKHERANGILQHILDINDGQHAVCHFLIANNAASLGHFAQAKKHAEHYLQLEPTGNCAEEAQDLLDLLAEDLFFQPLYNEADEQLLHLHTEARTYLRTAQLDKAMQLLEEITTTYPSHWAAQNHLAEVIFRKGEHKSAFSLCATVLDSDPGNLLTYCNLALFHYKLGHTKEVSYYKRLLTKILPIHIDHSIRLVEVLCTLEQYEEVMHRSLLSFIYYEDDPHLLRCYGVAAYNTGDTAQATSLFTQAAEHGCQMSEQLLAAMKQEQSGPITFSAF